MGLRFWVQGLGHVFGSLSLEPPEIIELEHKPPLCLQLLEGLATLDPLPSEASDRKVIFLVGQGLQKGLESRMQILEALIAQDCYDLCHRAVVPPVAAWCHLLPPCQKSTLRLEEASAATEAQCRGRRDEGPTGYGSRALAGQLGSSLLRGRRSSIK